MNKYLLTALVALIGPVLVPSRAVASAGIIAVMLLDWSPLTGLVLGDDRGIKELSRPSFRDVEPLMRQYLKGEKQVTGTNMEDAQKVAAAAAQWFCSPGNRADLRVDNREALEQVRKRFAHDFMEDALDNSQSNRAFMNMFNKQVIVLVRARLTSDYQRNRASQIHAVLILSVLAQDGDEALGDGLTHILEDATVHDEIKLYILQGLQRFFRAWRPKWGFLDEAYKAEDAARVAAVLAVLTRQPGKEMSQQQLTTWRMLRLEAIKALGETRMPAERVETMKVKTPVALELMKLLAADRNGIKPAPSLSEKAEAAIALGWMGDLMEQYRPDGSIYLVGNFVVEFALTYAEDHSKESAPGHVRLLDWESYALRLTHSLDVLRHSNRAAVNWRKTAELSLKCHDVLLGIRRHRPIGNLRPLIAVVSQHRPQSSWFAPYKGNDNAKVWMPAAKGAP
jgi:hypothetical protein